MPNYCPTHGSSDIGEGCQTIPYFEIQHVPEPTPAPDMPKGEPPVPQAEIDAFNAAAQHLPPAPKEN
jgi:hypothetical protein